MAIKILNRRLEQGEYVEKLCSCKISAIIFLNMKYRVRIMIDSPS